MDETTTRVVLRHDTSGDVYVADTDGETGHVYNAVGPLHYSEVRAAFNDPEWNTEGLPDDLNGVLEHLQPAISALEDWE